MKIRIRKSAVKDLRRIDRKNKERIHAKIQELTRYPHVPNIKKLIDYEPAYRLRVGNYRILFDVVGDRIEIAHVLHRKESYKR